MKNPLFDVSSWLHIAGIAHSRLRKFSHRSSHLPSRNGAVLCGVLQKLFKMFSCLFYSISVTIFKSTLLDKIFHYNRFLELLYVWWNGTNLLRLVNS